MAERRRGSYSPEFRQKAADLAMASDAQLGDIAKTLNVIPSTLSNWIARRKRELLEQSKNTDEIGPHEKQLPLTSKPHKPESHKPEPQSEIDKLRREVQKLRQERKVVKEAILLLTT